MHKKFLSLTATTMENIEININAIFREILNRRQSDGALSYDEYVDLVDEVLEEKREHGEINDDFEFQQAHEDLLARWNTVEAGTASDEDASDTEPDEPVEKELVGLDDEAKHVRSRKSSSPMNDDGYPDQLA